MKKVIILGAGSWARLVKYYIESCTNWNIVAFTDDQKSIESDTYEGYPLIPLEMIDKKYPPKEFEMIMGIGYRRMSTIREQKYNEFRKKGYSFPNFIHQSAILNNLVLGDGNFIMENVVFEPFTTIGKDNVFMTSTMTAHDNIIGSHNFFSLCVCIAGDVTIGNNCFLGIHSSIRNSIKIDNYTLVGAGAYVCKSTEPYSIITPAKSVTRLGQKSTDVM